jgi:hypothetical protein
MLDSNLLRKPNDILSKVVHPYPKPANLGMAAALPQPHPPPIPPRPQPQHQHQQKEALPSEEMMDQSNSAVESAEVPGGCWYLPEEESDNNGWGTITQQESQYFNSYAHLVSKKKKEKRKKNFN